MIFRNIHYIFFVGCLLTFYINSGQAQDTGNHQDLITLETYCPANPSCVYSGEKIFLLYTKIINNSDFNLEIPLAAIKDSRIWGSFRGIKTGNYLGRASGRPLANPALSHKLTLLPAHSEIIVAEGGALGDEIKESFYDAKSNQFLYQVSIDTEAYYQGSQEPIGYYQDGKFKTKIFKLKSHVIITKKKGLRLGHVLKSKDRPVIVY